MDDQAGHVVGCAGSGLKQVHDISGTKVSVSPTVTAGFRLVTIRGTNRQVGDALTAISKRLARRCLRSPKTAKKVKAPSSGDPITVRGPNDSFGNQTGRTSNSSKTTEAKRHGSKTTRV